MLLFMSLDERGHVHVLCVDFVLRAAFELLGNITQIRWFTCEERKKEEKEKIMDRLSSDTQIRTYLSYTY